MDKYFTKSSLRIFGLSFLIVFVASVLLNLGVSISLPGGKRDDKTAEMPIEKVKKLLNEKKNYFQLKKQSNIISSAFADEIKANPTAYSVVDFGTGEIVAEKNGDQRLPIASITKIMTAVVALDLAKEDEEFYISEDSADQIPTKIGVVSGERMTLKELLNASLLTSANDATEAIREGIDEKYGGEVFIDAMNLKAKNIGLNDTSYSNPQGFDGYSNYSTARDLAVLSHYAMLNYPTIREIAIKDYQYLPEDPNHKQFDLQNWNGLIGVYPGAQGIKIGSTEAAGKTTAVMATRQGKTIIAIVLGAPDILERDLWAAELLDYGFTKTAGISKANITEEDLMNKYSTWKYW
jgi:serine-type D-Ala-D-Ala carboxypeptidase (penicillin-binding protein 5/6)